MSIFYVIITLYNRVILQKFWTSCTHFSYIKYIKSEYKSGLFDEPFIAAVPIDSLWDAKNKIGGIDWPV